MDASVEGFLCPESLARPSVIFLFYFFYFLFFRHFIRLLFFRLFIPSRALLRSVVSLMTQNPVGARPLIHVVAPALLYTLCAISPPHSSSASALLSSQARALAAPGCIDASYVPTRQTTNDPTHCHYKTERSVVGT